MRWVEGGGPATCRACQRRRRQATRCGRCGQVELFAESEPVARLLLEAHTQWERNPQTGGRARLPYESLETVLRWTGATLSPDQRALLRAAEAEIISLDAKAVAARLNQQRR